MMSPSFYHHSSLYIHTKTCSSTFSYTFVSEQYTVKSSVSKQRVSDCNVMKCFDTKFYFSVDLEDTCIKSDIDFGETQRLCHASTCKLYNRK